MESETQLMAVRLAAISEILSLQEARLTQVYTMYSTCVQSIGTLYTLYIVYSIQCTCTCTLLLHSCMSMYNHVVHSVMYTCTLCIPYRTIETIVNICTLVWKLCLHIVMEHTCTVHVHVHVCVYAFDKGEGRTCVGGET